MRRILAIIILAVFFGSAAASAVIIATGVVVAPPGKIALIRIEGAIQAGESSLFAPTTSSEEIAQLLKQAREDPSIRAVVIRVNSPGGEAGASQEIYREILRLRDAGKPVVVSVGSIATSGGYYIACAADRILAEPGAIVGSIGAIMIVPQFEEFFERLGVRFVVIKGGELKDIGTPFRAITPEEREILQEMITDVHEQFIQDVAEGRNLPIEKVREIADGRPFTAQQARELGLIDDFGNLNDAIELASDIAGIERPAVVELKRKTMLEGLIEAITLTTLREFARILRSPAPVSPTIFA